MPRRAVRPKGHKRIPAWWVTLQPLLRPVHRGYAHGPEVNMEALKLEAEQARELAKELTWNS